MPATGVEDGAWVGMGVPVMTVSVGPGVMSGVLTMREDDTGVLDLIQLDDGVTVEVGVSVEVGVTVDVGVTVEVGVGVGVGVGVLVETGPVTVTGIQLRLSEARVDWTVTVPCVAEQDA